MTYLEIKALTQVLLSGDMTFPDDEVEALMALRYALEEVASTADVAILSFPIEAISDPTFDDRDIIRITTENRVLFRARLPDNDNSVIEVDEGLTYAVSRYMASYVSFQNSNMHRTIAKELVEKYNENNAYILGVLNDN